MSEEQVPEPAPKRKSVLPKLLLLAVVMLLVALAVNLKDLRAIAAGEKTFTSVLYGRSLASMTPSFAFPEPLGPEDAKVKAVVVCQEGNSCHEPLVVLWAAIAKLEPERLRVEFRQTGAPAMHGGPTPGKAAPGNEKASAKTEAAPELGCESGVTLNGDMKFELGTGKEKRVVYLTGPTPAPPAMSEGKSPEGGHGWSTDDVIAIVNQRLEKAYGGKGTLTAEGLKAAMTEASQELPRPTGEEGAKSASH